MGQLAANVRSGQSAILVVRGEPGIGAQLFIGARMVEWHPRKVFARLGISSRRELDQALRLAQARVRARDITGATGGRPRDRGNRQPAGRGTTLWT